MEKRESAKDVQTGDRVQLETGEWVTVTRVGESISPGDTMLVDWKGKSGTGSGRLFPDEQVPVCCSTTETDGAALSLHSIQRARAFNPARALRVLAR